MNNSSNMIGRLVHNSHVEVFTLQLPHVLHWVLNLKGTGTHQNIKKATENMLKYLARVTFAGKM